MSYVVFQWKSALLFFRQSNELVSAQSLVSRDWPEAEYRLTG